MLEAEDDGEAVLAQRLKDLIEGLRAATRLDGDVGHGAVSDLTYRLDRVVPRDVDRVRRTEAAGVLESVVVPVGDDHLERAAADHEVGEVQADRPLTKDDDALA